MFNVGGGEILVILLIALIFLGPDKMPDAAKKVGRMLGEVRRMTSGFQEEIRSAMDIDGTGEASKRADTGPRLLETPPVVPEPGPSLAEPTADKHEADPTAPPDPGHGDTSAA